MDGRWSQVPEIRTTRNQDINRPRNCEFFCNWVRRTPRAKHLFCAWRIIALVSGTTTHPSGFLKVNLVWLLQCQIFRFSYFYFFFIFLTPVTKQNSLLFYFTQHLPYFLLYRPRPDAAPVEFSPYSLFRCKYPCRIFNQKRGRIARFPCKEVPNAAAT
jgi:hypothetical protein